MHLQGQQTKTRDKVQLFMHYPTHTLAFRRHVGDRYYVREHLFIMHRDVALETWNRTNAHGARDFSTTNERPACESCSRMEGRRLVLIRLLPFHEAPCNYSRRRHLIAGLSFGSKCCRRNTKRLAFCPERHDVHGVEFPKIYRSKYVLRLSRQTIWGK